MKVSRALLRNIFKGCQTCKTTRSKVFQAMAYLGKSSRNVQHIHTPLIRDISISLKDVWWILSAKGCKILKLPIDPFACYTYSLDLQRDEKTTGNGPPLVLKWFEKSGSLYFRLLRKIAENSVEILEGIGSQFSQSLSSNCQPSWLNK